MQKGSQQKSAAIKVYVRVRPLVGQQIGTNQIVEVEQDGKTVNITTDAVTALQIKFDQALPKQSTQKDFFNLFTQYIPKIPEGYNLTVFAYGQTGSGKTYTMFGSDWEYTVSKNTKSQHQNTFFEDLQSDQNYAGLIPRTIFSLFQQIKKVDNGQAPLFNIYCSFLQIYNQKIYDLLQDFPKPKALNIHESKVDGIFVEGLAQYAVTHYLDCLQLMKRGQKNRFIRQTSMNTKSSRSHTIFQILLQSTHPDTKGMFKKARLNLCDLAGSQKVNKGQTMGVDHFKQLKNINQSLTTLGKVIASLSSKVKSIASFRQSKLTRLLQQSLTVNTYTFIIGNISPSSNNIDQTMNTLKFVQRARHIVMKVKPMQFNGQNMEIINKLQKEISYLKQLLNLKRKGMTADDIHSKLVNLQEENQKLKKTSVSFQDVQKLIEENHRMKQQIHKLQMTQYAQSENGVDETKSDFSLNSYRKSNEFATTQELSNKIVKKTSGFQIHSMENLQQKKQYSKSPPSTKKQIYTPGETKKSLVSAGKKLLQSHDSSMYSTPITQNGSRKKQKQKILDKLQELQRIQKFNEEKLMKDLQQLERKSLTTNKTSQQIPTKKKSFIVPSTAEKKASNNVNYQQKIRQLQAKLFGK